MEGELWGRERSNNLEVVGEPHNAHAERGRAAKRERKRDDEYSQFWRYRPARIEAVPGCLDTMTFSDGKGVDQHIDVVLATKGAMRMGPGRNAVGASRGQGLIRMAPHPLNSGDLP